jgi:hypothetical protein
MLTMKATNHVSPKAPSLIAIHKRTKKDRNNPDKKFLSDKNILQKIFHPDYILFDWEYFSRELEFE